MIVFDRILLIIDQTLIVFLFNLINTAQQI